MIKRRSWIRLLSFFCAGLLVAGVFCRQQQGKTENALRVTRYAGEHAFEELCAAVRGMDTALQKSLRSTAPAMTASLCAEVYARALSASAALGSMPGSVGELEQTAAFFARSGDYAAYLVGKSAAGEALTEEEQENLLSLSQTCTLLEENLTGLRGDITNGFVTGDALRAAEEGIPSLGDSLLQMEQEFPETPSMVYDGPFSASVADRKPRMLENAADIAETDGIRVAAAYLGAPASSASSQGGTEGDIPVWRVQCGEHTVSVTRSGGYVIRDISSRIPTETVLTVEEAAEKAKAFLASHGFESMEESYHLREGAMLTFTFCHAMDDILCYPDMVKLTLALDNGEILRLDAEPYLTSHGERTVPEMAFSEEEAAERVPQGYTLLSQRTAVIPSAGAEERFCRELVCEDGSGGHCLLYYNAENGKQEKILLLLEDETGTLAR